MVPLSRSRLSAASSEAARTTSRSLACPASPCKSLISSLSSRVVRSSVVSDGARLLAWLGIGSPQIVGDRASSPFTAVPKGKAAQGRYHHRSRESRLPCTAWNGRNERCPHSLKGYRRIDLSGSAG